MTWEIIHPEGQRTAKWAGGTTTELFIYPTDAVYSERNFDFRISTAKVELETSEFTSLPGYRRHIMPVVGELGIEHHGHYGAELSPYEADIFEGGWQTKAYGKCTDFNLMYTRDWMGGLCRAESSRISCHRDGYTGLYAQRDLTVTLPGEEQEMITLAAGDFLLFQLEADDPTMEVEVSEDPGDDPVIVVACHRRNSRKLKI